MLFTVYTCYLPYNIFNMLFDSAPSESKRTIFDPNLGGASWFLLNNSETVIPATLAFCSI